MSKLIRSVKDFSGDISSDRKNRTRFLTSLGGVLLVALGAIGQMFNGEASMIDASYGDLSIFYLFNAIASCFGFILITITIDKRMPLFKFYGKNSLTVLCTHMFYIEAFWMLNSQIFHLPLGEVNASLFALGVILLEVPTILMINKYFPWLIGQRKKPRTVKN